MAVMLPFKCHARKGEADAQRGLERPLDGARYLGSASPTASMRDRHLEDAQPGTSCAHLHLEVPAVSHLAHAELFEGLAADGAEGAHVGIGNAVEQARQRAGTVSSRDLQRVHSAGLALVTGARADHEVVRAGQDWREQRRHELGLITAIAVEEYDDAAVTRGPGARGAGAAVAALPFYDDTRARIAGAFDGPILAVA